MISQELTKFEYIDRGTNKLAVLIPGWASDYRIFASLDIKFNYLIPVNYSPTDFKEQLFKSLQKHNTQEVSIFAHSMGGFLAADFVKEHSHLIHSLILISIRKKYNSEDLLTIKEYLKKNKRAYLHKFYSQCFHSKESLASFREDLLGNYCEKFELDYLCDALDYLESAEIKSEHLSNVKNIKIVHGEEDNIAPIHEAKELHGDIPHAQFISIKDTGHMPFLREDFSRHIYDEKNN